MSQREILFKAKRTDTGEWVEGYPFPSIAGKELNRMTVIEHFPGGATVSTYEVEPETVCQYTGLTDKNGKKIFENDIVGFRYKTRRGAEKLESYIVSWGHNGYSLFDSETGFDPYRLEVIGNIFDD